MEQSFFAAATLNAALACAPAALNLTLLTDGEALSMGAAPDADAFSQLPAHGSAIESLIPEIRQLAMLFSARRYQVDDGGSPHLSDAADWLAARIVLLELSHLRLPLSCLPLLDKANARIRALGRELGMVLPQAMLQTAGSSDGQIQAASRLPAAALRDAGAVTHSLRLRDSLRLRMQPLLGRLGLA